MIDVESASPFYPDLSGMPLQGGTIYYGVSGQNPVTNPISVYWDAAGTQPASQPIKVVNGRPSRNGAVAQIYVSGDYSKMVLDAKGRQVLYVASQSSRNLATLPFVQQGPGAVSRSALAKQQDQVSPEDFGAIGDGAANDTAAIQAMLVSGAKRMVGRGSYLVSALDLSTLPAGGVLDFSAATIKAVPTLAAPAVKMGGIGQTIMLGDVVTPAYQATGAVGDGAAILLESGFYNRYEVGQVLGFRSPLQVKPTRGFNGNNGLSWLTFRSKFLATDTGDCVYMRANEGGGGINTGYITESDWHFGRLDGTRGIVIDANPTQVANTAMRNNGNRIHAPSFENVTGDALVMVANNRNTLMQARFENVGGLYINEDAACARNRYIVGFGVRSDKLQLLGILEQLDAQLSDATGGVTSLWRTGLSTAGNAFGYADAYSLALNGSLAFTDNFGRIMDDRWLVKRLDGTRRRIRLYADNENDFVAPTTAGNYAVDKATRSISVSTGTNAVTLVMPAEKEFNGESMLLHVRALTNPLKIQKSSGSVGSKADSSIGGTNLTSVGSYLLVFENDVWTPLLISTQLPS